VQNFFRFVTIHAFDRRTDGRTAFSRIDRLRSMQRGKKSACDIALMLLSCVGNDAIHLLTTLSGRRHRLRIDMTDWGGQKRYAEYDNFKLGSERENYKLISLGRHSGNAGQ